ncbi:TetR family transcriptional regulator [Nocardia harenae]|uniref:TetR family transcriptional regulator n=1 Tax=Nocardia harenae TaxID=358707 RepID=UPI000834A32B|nr:TetR family transcriptional regulator [Nocardia harenae]
MTRPPLRERQRLAVRAELQRTALEMFVERGFDNVSVNDIVDRVGVVQRTFYRHFSSKEDAVISLFDEVAPVVHRHVRDHPGGEPPWRVLMGAMVATARECAAVDAAVVRLIYDTPRLLSAYTERERHWVRMVADIIAERMGVRPDDDARPMLWSSLAFTITDRASFENAVLNRQPRLLDHLEDRFEQAAELFTGRLP